MDLHEYVTLRTPERAKGDEFSGFDFIFQTLFPGIAGTPSRTVGMIFHCCAAQVER